MLVNRTGIESLPNEIFVQVLASFPTRALLPLASISKRFYDLVLRILHHRLLDAATLQDHKLILECYHPSARLTTPGLACDYLGTDGLSGDVEDEGQLYRDVERTGRLGKLAGLFSHFRPVGPEQERRPRRRRHPAGDVPGYPDSSTSYPGALPHNEDEIPSQIVSLESHELFSQLCTIANLVKVVPNIGFLLSCITIGEGVLRIWRNWLADNATLSSLQGRREIIGSFSGTRSAQNRIEDDKRILWLDHARNVGIRLRVIEREDLGAPIISSRDEDAAVTYSVEYEELVIRTTQLLLKVEESILKEKSDSGKAIILGSYERRDD